MSNWTQPQCERCWVVAHAILDGNGNTVGVERLPHMVLPAEHENWTLELCAWCGSPTFVGIYRRVDPTTVPYPRPEDE